MYIPLGFSRDNELVDNYLSPVGEVSKLCLPETESVWIGLRVTQLVAEHCEFRQVRIACNKSTNITLRSYVVDWDVETIHVLVKYMSMSVRECSSLNVLS